MFRKSPVCRACNIPITLKPGNRDKICPECATERVMLYKWNKRSTEDIELHIESMYKTIKLLSGVLLARREFKNPITSDNELLEV